jgi:DNA repair exonuclease SbcCD ATPase subunit
MDYEKRIKALLEENEFLQTELEDANRMLLDKTATPQIEQPSAAFVNSQIALNKIEIKHLQQKLEEETQRAAAWQGFNETLEYNLLQANKKAKLQNETLAELTANQIHVNVVQEEAAEMSSLLKKLKQLKSNLAEAHSKIEFKQIEIDDLKGQLEEMKALVSYLQQKKGKP